MKKLIVTFMTIIMFFPTVILADTGPKPSINVTLKNIEGTDYLIDLMSDFTDKQDLINEIVDRYQDYKEREIYKYHEDNWYATALRNFLLWGDLTGNSEHEHRFTYFGVPSEFKVIIELSDGTIKVGDKIKKTGFNFNITIDVNDMKVIDSSSSNSGYSEEDFKINFDIYFGVLIITILVEVGIAFIFKTKKYHIIAIVNLLTNICLQLLMINIDIISSSILCFALIEIAIILIELFTYLKLLDIEKNKIILYTIIANIITAVLTFWL